MSRSRPLFVLLAAAGTFVGCSKAPPSTQPSPAQNPTQTPNRVGALGAAAPSDTQDRGAGGAGGGGFGAARPRPYNRVITREAVTRRGMFAVHRVGDRLYFEIPEREMG